jgi:histidinol-phosphate aminotransferase
MSVLELARPDIRTLQPYSSARSEILATASRVLLNANESSWTPDGDETAALNRYPEPQPAALVDRLAALYAVERSQVLVTRGSDEAIDLLVRAFCPARQSAVLIAPPTFGMYAVCARVQGADVVEVPLRAPDFALDVDAVLAAVHSSATTPVRIVFLTSPNNPTGAAVPAGSIERLARGVSGRALLVVDEAYLEFSGQESATRWIGELDHVCILRTLSKARALAGARVGCLVADAAVIGLLRRILAPYPLPQPSVRAALAALTEARGAEARQNVQTVVRERARMAQLLAAVPGVRAVLPSDANFLAVRFDAVQTVQDELLAEGIVVRDVRRYPGLEDALRLTIGRPEENERVVRIIRRASSRERAA